jgi:hypothetical protein
MKVWLRLELVSIGVYVIHVPYWADEVATPAMHSLLAVVFAAVVSQGFQPRFQNHADGTEPPSPRGLPTPPMSTQTNSSGSPVLTRTVSNPENTLPTGQRRRFVEMCVSTSPLKIALGEIALDAAGATQNVIDTDAQLFKSMHDRYCQMRRHRTFSWLYMPMDIQFVRFSVYDGGHVGIYERPMSLPPKTEVEAGSYHYYECPLDLLPPIDHRTFFHYFWNHKMYAKSKSRIFLNHLPKKLNTSMREQEQFGQLNLGWGIHIIEGPTTKLISVCLFLIILLSFGVSVGFSIATHAQESGFGIGQ